MDAHVGPYVSLQIRRSVMTAWGSRSHPGGEQSLHFLPQKATALGHIAGLAGLPCSPPCPLPTGLALPHSPPLDAGEDQVSDAGADRCPIPTASAAPNYRDTKRCITCGVTVSVPHGTIRGTALYLLGDFHQQTSPKQGGWQPRVQRRQTSHLPHPRHCSVPSQFLCPPTPTSLFKVLHPEPTKKGNSPSCPKDHMYLCCVIMKEKISFTSQRFFLFQFPIGH